MAVIVGQSRADVMRPFLEAWQQRNQNQPLLDAQTARENALTQDIATKSATEQAKAKLEDFKTRVGDPLIAAGQREQASQLFQKFVADNPDVQKLTAAVAAPSTQLDTAAGNVATWKANQTGTAAAGNNSPMANTVTAKLATGDYLPNQAFTYQGATNIDQPKGTPAQPGPEAAGMIQRETGAATTAAQDQQSQTQKDVAAMNIAASKPLRDAQIAHENEGTRGEKLQNDMSQGLSSALAPNPNAAPGTAGASPAATGSTLAPQDVSKAPAIVQQLVNRSFDPTLMRRWKPGEMEAVTRAVQQYDPSFNMADYANQAAVKKQFTSGAYSQNILSANQLIGHLDALNTAYTKLNNGDYPLINKINNYVGEQGGDKKVQAALGGFNTAADAVATEAARLYKGTGSTAEKEIAEWRKTVSPLDPPSKFNSSVAMLFDLLQTRLDQMDETYRSGVGRPRDFEILKPQSKAILKKFNVGQTDTTSQVPTTGPNMGTNVPDSGTITTPDGLKWKKNPDGSMTQVQ